MTKTLHFKVPKYIDCDGHQHKMFRYLNAQYKMHKQIQ